MESTSGFGALGLVTGGVTLAALIVLAVVGVLRAGIAKDVDVLKAIDGSSKQIAARERVALATLEKLQIDTKDMSSADKKELALVQLMERRKRLTIVLVFGLALGVVGGIVGAIALTSSYGQNRGAGISTEVITPGSATRSWGFWRIEIELPGDRFAPGVPLDLKVRSDHAGYIWMFSPNNTQPILAYPHPDDERLALNTIEANEWRPVPLLGHDHYGIAAAMGGKSVTSGTEELIVIVTAESNRETALRHLAAMRPELEIKATAIATGDWGSTSKSYQVTR